MNTSTTIAGLSVLASLCACDVALFPETAQYAETFTPRATINVLADAMPGDGVLEVELDVAEVVLERRDATPILVGTQEATVVLDGVQIDCAYDDVPVGVLEIDAIAVELAGVRVRTAEGWATATLLDDLARVESVVTVDRDVTLDLHVDLQAGLARDEQGWTFVPVLRVSAR